MAGAGQPVAARYVAIITDGNGRWARERGVPVNDGHDAGADTVKARLRDAAELGIEELTVYSFSTENWSRPAEEVQGLMEMFSRRIAGETPELHEEGVRMRFIGRREGVEERLAEQMRWAEELTGANERITLFVAFNYGGRAEILDAARRFAGKRVAQAAEGRPAGPLVLQSDVAQAAEGRPAGPLALDSDEGEFRACLYAPEMHDPDLIIRTSGERRLSNYLLWQSAYSELVFRDELWPDFTREALEQSLAEYAERRRRFGGR
jgi:undecaprenyl diphosphate synthase